MVEAFLVALAVFICVGGAELAGFTMLNRPIVIGVVNIGGASAAEPGIATAVGTAFAIMMGKGSEVALTLALPIGILGLQIKTLLYIFIVGMFAKTFDRLAQEGKQKQITALHYGLWAVNWALYSLVAFFGICFGRRKKIFKKSILAVCNIVCGSKPGKTRSIWVLLFTDAGA